MSRRRILDRSSHTALQNNEKVAHPTRFERVTFAFGEQRFHWSIDLAGQSGLGTFTAEERYPQR
jgi:hypothetical protein